MIPLSKPLIGKEEIAAVVAVLESGMIAQGPRVKELEEKFARYCGTKYAVALNSGTAALHSALYALDIKPGDEVITTPFTFVATANVILMQGAKVIFADIKSDDFNIDPDDVERKITKRTKAIITVDLYGQIYNYGRLKKMAAKNGIKIVEDACQAVGAGWNGKKAGSCGDVAAFSLYATKNITSGEGGVLTTDSEKIMERAKMFRHHGQSETQRYEYVDLGYNYRLTDMAAALAIEQLKKADRLNTARIKNATRLARALRGIKGLIVPVVKKSYRHVFHQFTVKITKDFKTSREDFIDYLRSQGIGCGVYYPKPLHLHSHFRRLGYHAGDFPVSEQMSHEVLSLPVHPLLSSKELSYIIQKIHRYVK